MKITVCIGSSCHLKGSRLVVEKLRSIISERHLEDKVNLSGAFCMGNCQNGVCVMVEDKFYSVLPETVESFFENEVLEKFGKFVV